MAAASADVVAEAPVFRLAFGRRLLATPNRPTPAFDGRTLPKWKPQVDGRVFAVFRRLQVVCVSAGVSVDVFDAVENEKKAKKKKTKTRKKREGRRLEWIRF